MNRIGDAEITQLLELHAALLATDGALAADALARAADDDVASLMALAERVFRALPPVTPDPAFRAALEARLERAAARARAPLRAARGRRRRRTALAFACGAALGALAGAVVGGLAGGRPATWRRA
jgi:hypothetical protein